MGLGHYILDGDGNHVECSLMEWAEWMENPANRVVQQNNTPNYMVSTVFLGLNHSWSDEGPPILFETMVFPRTEDSDVNWAEQFCWRYATVAEAKIGHQELFEKAMAREGMINRLLDTGQVVDEESKT